MAQGPRRPPHEQGGGRSTRADPQQPGLRRGLGRGRTLKPRLVLCDPPAGPFWPLSATRPVAELLAGARSFRARWEAREKGAAALVCDPAVGGSLAPDGDGWPDPSAGWKVALSTWLPPEGWSFGSEPAEWRLDGGPVAWLLAADQARAIAAGGSAARGSPADPAQARARLEDLGLPIREVEGRRLDAIWSVMEDNPRMIAEDAVDFGAAETISGVDPIVVLGAPPKVAPGVSVGPFSVLDSREGPILLDGGARIEAHTICTGPLYVGPDSILLGGPVGHGTSIGPCCRIRGQVEATIVQGYSNKAHDGFLGHSVLGAWVNLGAGTTNSDLKNTYGPVRVGGPDGAVDTGLLKAGAFIGDHVRTGIGTLLTTGARLGVGTHLFGGRAVSPDYLPPFSWHDGVRTVPVRWEAFLATTEIAMARRDRRLSDEERRLLRALLPSSGAG